MSRTNYQRGADKERRIMNYFRKKGCISARSAGSHSIIDVWALNPITRQISLIQAKLGYLPRKEKERIILEGNQLNGVYEVTFELWD